MVDKYHNEWILRDISTEYRIFKAQSMVFHFLSDMANDLDDAIAMLEGIEQLPELVLQLELLKRKLFYLKMANGIGKIWEV